MEEEEETGKRQETMKEKEELKRKREASSSAAYLENFKRSKVEVYPKGKLQEEELSASAEPNVSRIQEDETNKFDKTEGFVTVHGVFYEVKMCMLVFLKLLNLKATFSLCSNLKEAKTIDDVVVHYKYNDNVDDVSGALFIQLKHAEKSDVTRSISFYKGRPYFRLLDFFLSFSISHRIENHEILSCGLDNRYYLIFTNADVDRNLLTEDTEFSSILDDITGYGTVLKLKESEEYEEFKRFIKNLSNIFDDSSHNQRNAAKEIYNSINKGDFVVKEGKLGSVSRSRSLEVLKHICINYKNINIKKIDDFLSKMRICCCQANVDMLDHFITNEIESALTVSEAETEAVFTKLREKFILWHDRESYYLTQNGKIWADISKKTRDERPKNVEMRSLGIKFNDVSVSSMIDIINDNRFLNIVSTGATTTLPTFKVWQALESVTPQSYLLVSVRECTKQSHDLWNIWPNRWCKTLVIEFDADCDDVEWIKDQLISSLRSNPYSKVILITSQNRSFVTDNIRDMTFEIHIDDINFDQLDEFTQKQIFETRLVNFQGSKVDLKDIFMEKQLKMLDTDQMTNLVRNEFTVGKPISEYQQEGYISRNIQIPCVNENIFCTSATRNVCSVVAIELLQDPQDFILSNNAYSVEDLLKLRPHNFKHEALNDCYYAILKKGREDQEFETLCETFSSVHWIKQYENYFVWKKSKGNMNTIKSHLNYSENHNIPEEDFIINDFKSPVLISGEPGMGKSSLLKHMAMVLKERYPHNWVVLVELSKYCEFFRNCGKVTREKVFQIICRAASLKINSSLLSKNFDSLEKFILLLDAFDEIGPHYTDVAQKIIKYLIELSCFVLVTCRPADISYLEEKFSISSHLLQPLDEEMKEKLLTEKWKMKENLICKTYCMEQAQYLLNLHSKQLNDPNRTFTGNPLHIIMLSEISDIVSIKVSEATEQIINVFQMFNLYLRKKCEVYYKEKMKCNISESVVKENLDNFMSDIIDVNKKISASIMFLNEIKTNGLEILFSKDKAFDCSVKAGIIKETENKFPEYMHRLFVEYFAALWLAENYLQNVMLMKEIVSQNKLEMVRKFYNLKCSENNMFLTAILTSNDDYVTGCIVNTSVINSTDAMGRTALHLTASVNDETMSRKLLNHHIDTRLKDKIGWTALDYAIHSHSWEALNSILAVFNYTEHESEQLWETTKIYVDEIIFMCCMKELPHILKFVCKNVNLNKEFHLTKKTQFYSRNKEYKWFRGYSAFIPIHVAAEYNQIDTVKELQCNKCDIEIRDEELCTLLHIAAYNGHLELVKYLIKEGLSIKNFNYYGLTTLDMACWGGHTVIIKELIENGADVNDKDFNRNTPLLKCCEISDVYIIKYLLEKGADINHCNIGGQTPAFKAIQCRNIEVFKYLVENGANLNYHDTEGNTVLFLVCCNHDLGLVKYCVDHGADLKHINNNGDTILTYASDNARLETIKYCIEKTDLVNHANNEGNTVLFTASKAGRLDIIKHCVEKGADLNHSNNKGNTVLFIAVKAGRLDIVKHCVENGADLNHSNNKGNTVIFIAAKAGSLDIVVYCIENGADISHNNNDGYTALFYAIGCTYSGKKYDIIHYLLVQGADINHANINRLTPLLIALIRGKLNIVCYLRQHGANINHADIDGNTVLMYAIIHANLRTFQYCVEEGADINHVNNDRDTALLSALMQKRLDIAWYCLQKGANCNHANNKGDTPLLIAARIGNIDFFKYCHEHGADLNCSNNDGDTALLFALRQRHRDIAWYCLQKGANCDQKNNTGDTPVLIAARIGCKKFVKYCLEYGSGLNCNNNDGDTALLFALRERHLDIAWYCLQKGANCKESNKNGDTPLLIAARIGRIGIVKYCHEHGADLNCSNNDGDTALLLALIHKHLDIAWYCLQKGANCNQKNKNGDTPMLIAARIGNIEFVKYCYEHGSDLNCSNNNGDTALLLALIHKHLDIAWYCLQNGANCKESNKNGDIPLLIAASLGNIELFKFCHEHGADLNCRTNDGDTALLISLVMKHLDIAWYCLQKGAKCNHANNKGDTPLLIAARIGSIDVVKYCHEHGADLNCENNYGCTALFFATFSRHEEIVQYLEQNGANPVIPYAFRF